MTSMDHVRLGIKHGYPICCVIQFALGEALGVKRQAVRRGGIRRSSSSMFVPCILHRHLSCKWEPYDPTILFLDINGNIVDRWVATTRRRK